MITLAQIFGPLSLWASLPSFLLYYLFYSTFEHNDPEGPVKDTKVCLFNKFFFFAHDTDSFDMVIILNKTQLLLQQDKNWLF